MVEASKGITISMAKNKTSREAAKGKPATSKKNIVDVALEDFIKNSTDLLEAFPSASVSIAYTVNKDKEHTGVKFTVSHSGQSKVLTYESHDAKEVSRILAFIGPGGVTADSVNSSRTIKDTTEEEKIDENSSKIPERITGLLSVMSNYNFHS